MNLYNKNGILFWTEKDIDNRNNFENIIKNCLKECLLKQNRSFNFVKVEAPILTPNNLINSNYTEDDVYINNDLTLRPETTMGSYTYGLYLLDGHSDIKYKAPLVVYQHGKSFRRESDQSHKFMRLKEFYQLEFQIIFSKNTANDYSIKLYEEIKNCLSSIVGDCRLEESDRLPSYSEETIDIVLNSNNMELCSMSKRNDLEGYSVIEIAIGTDRCLYNFNKKTESTPVE